MSHRTMGAKALAVAAATAATIALTSCSGSSGNDAALAPITDPQAVSGTVNVLAWQGSDGPLKAVIPAFEKEYPNLTVNLEVVGYDDVSTRLTVGLQSGTNLPDVVGVTVERMKTVTGTFPDGLVDLSTFGLDERESEWAPAKWPAATGDDNELFGVPWDMGPVAVYYRADLFEQAGIDPASIVTWDDYLAAGDKLQDLGVKLFPLSVANSQLYSSQLQQLGESYFTDSGEVNLDSDDSIAVATRLQKAVQGGYAEIVNNDDGLTTALKSGAVGSLIMPVWYSGSFQTNLPEMAGQWGVLTLPELEDGGSRASNQGGSYLVVPAKSSNPQGGYLFATFALGTVDSANTMMELGSMSSLLAAHSEPAFTEPVDYFGGQKVYQLFADTIPDIAAVPFTSDYDKADQIVIDAMNKIVVSNADPASTMKDAAAQLRNQIGQ
ncbi:ABC transporter substrate-binding protein [Compostimonas suwonensis]|uniref:Lactose/L-arabinose transport system substrate-binding protein n=1 Tax=Compostimonas suwonensis TaxID=1048394 RepID=A0A2M9BVA0_9MICO|nr:extracellular solute-binding protein [Compostimonas suwonensis]PJJ61872.1 lactose/L-arabinose transport system substrate-binding protein [Compostimonas suwonensis]